MRCCAVLAFALLLWHAHHTGSLCLTPRSFRRPRSTFYPSGTQSSFLPRRRQLCSTYPTLVCTLRLLAVHLLQVPARSPSTFRAYPLLRLKVVQISKVEQTPQVVRNPHHGTQTGKGGTYIIGILRKSSLGRAEQLRTPRMHGACLGSVHWLQPSTVHGMHVGGPRLAHSPSAQAKRMPPMFPAPFGAANGSLAWERCAGSLRGV